MDENSNTPTIDKIEHTESRAMFGSPKENDDLSKDPENNDLLKNAKKNDLSKDPEKDPFRVRLEYSPTDYLKMVMMGLTIVPIRIIVAVLALVSAWAISCIGLHNMDMTKPISGWRKPLQKVTCLLGQVCCRCCGFSVSKKGTQLPPSEAPVLVVAPHSSFFDALVIFWCGLPIIINRVENQNLPFIGKCVQFAQAIFVTREAKESREQTKFELVRRVQDDGWKQLLIFPEGTTTNRKALMAFKPGGFLPGAPVQPVVVHYQLPRGKDTVSWTWDQPHGFITCFTYTICTWKTPVIIEYLPPYVPSEPEKEDPMLFSANVRKVMGDTLKVPLCDLTFEDIKNKYARNDKPKEE